MASPHASVRYVEPNYVFSGLTGVVNDGNIYDRAPDLDEYCIGLDIIVELSSRHKSVRDTSSENKVIVMSYDNTKGGKSHVRFMSGTKIGGYEKNNNGEFVPRLRGQNVLTSYYADMHITDLVDYGTTELVGIKSVDIDYNSTCVPVINMKFTDVRGMSIFQPSELNDDKSFNGIRGFSKDNIAQSFFHAFFTLPLPKYTVVLKGFYGQPVSYQVMCDKFDTAFDSKNGYFDVSARFIGFAYSFMSDVSFNALLAAPYSDYEGADYWDTQIKSGRFKLAGRNGEDVKMPKLYDVKNTIDTILVGTDNDLQQTTIEEEIDTHEIEIRELSDIRRICRTWYDALYNEAVTKYGKDYCYRIGGNGEDEDYQMVIVLTNGKNIDGADFSNEYLQFSESFRNITGQLYNAIDKFNNSGTNFKKLDNIKEGFKYLRVKTFRDIWFNYRTNLFVFDGFHSDNILPKKETIDTIFPEEEDNPEKTKTNQQKVLRKLYNDGKYQYLDAFVINLDYTSIKKRISFLIEDSNKQINDVEKKRKALNTYMYEQLEWYPTIENFTKIVMAHLETLMHMMYATIDKIGSRTVSQLAVACGEGGVTDVNQYSDEVPPFPRLTRLTTDQDGYVKSEDAWAGDFKDGIGFNEVDIINGLFNGAYQIKETDKYVQAAINNMNAQKEGGLMGTVPFPLTPYDFFMNTNPYGDDSDVVNDRYAFAAKICMRMFGVMQLSHFRGEYENDWLSMADKIGKVEARNFMALNKLKNPRLLMELGDGTIKNADDILDIVKGNTDGNLPWFDGNEGSKALFTGGKEFWLSKYRIVDSENKTNDRGLYPIGNLSFKSMNDLLGVVAAGKTPIENDDVIVIDTYSKCAENYDKLLKSYTDTSVLNTIKFTTDYKTIWGICDNAKASSYEEYKDVVDKITIREDDIPSYIFDNNGVFCNRATDETIMLKSDGGKNIQVRDPETLIYAGDGATKHSYKFENREQYANEMKERSIQSYVLTQCFGYTKDSKTGKYSINHKSSLFVDGLPTSDNESLLSTSFLRAAFFLSGLDCINPAHIKYGLGANDSGYLRGTFGYIPKLAALQIGAALAVYYSRCSISTSFSFEELSKYMPVSKDFKTLEKCIDGMTPYCKIGYIRYFRQWANDNIKNINQLAITRKNGIFSCRGGDHYEKLFYKVDSQYKLEQTSGEGLHARVETVEHTYVTDSRALFRQTSELIKGLTNDLMSLVCVVKLTGSAMISEPDGRRDMLFKYTFQMDESIAKNYLNAFINTIRDTNGIEVTEDGGPTTIAADATQTTVDMKIELYRYLKQLYDKWVSSTKFETWMFDKFFTDVDQDNNPLGNNFFFIDSFYNKIGDKLLINPKKMADVLTLAVSTMDTNTTMYTFLSQMYAEHRCMIKCVQNFKLLSEGIGDIFVPIPYEQMGKPSPFTDFVVVYTYEPSRNLNVANGEYKNDGFMLNDEFDTPLPIKSRGDERRYYRIPAFGVSYGRQYQHYFKSINVNMEHPVMTEQAIIAKHSILNAARNKKSKTATAQDLYDIYSNQSYTCVVEMMGCAYVQPLMYFVLLNVPFFKGSYLISKVRHRITPGDMTTEVTGVRMSKYSNKLVTEIFTDETDTIGDYGGYNDNDWRYGKADTSNDCPYKVFPIFEDAATGKESEVMSQTMIDNGIAVINKLMEVEPTMTKALAAGIAGNMSVESEFNPKALNPNDKGYMSGGLCQWRGGNLKSLIENTPGKYGRIKDKGCGYESTTKGDDKYNATIAKLPDSGTQITYLVNSLKAAGESGSYVGLGSTIVKFNELNGIGNPEEAAKKFRLYYEHSEKAEPERWLRANKLYNAVSAEKLKEDKKLADMYVKYFVDAIQKSLNSTEKYAGELKVTYVGASGAHITIDNGAEKLAVLFDIILNSYEYYSHVINLDWIINNAPNELPSAIMVVLRQEVQSRKITVAKGNEWVNAKFKGTECNEKLMQSLAKKYYSDKKIFVTECPQFINAVDSIDKFAPKDCNSLYDGGVEGVSLNSPWAKAVHQMGKWYQNNVHEYSKGKTISCNLLGGEKVKEDCSGFVAACLKLFGVNVGSPGSASYVSNALDTKLTNGGFKKMAYSWDTVQPFDIIAKNGHVEILAIKSDTPKSYGWGSCHDGAGKHPGMPAPMNKDKYTTIWRYLG